MNEFLTKKQLAKMLSCSTRYIELLQKNRVIPYMKISNRTNRYDLGKVLAALSKFNVPAI